MLRNRVEEKIYCLREICIACACDSFISSPAVNSNGHNRQHLEAAIKQRRN